MNSETDTAKCYEGLPTNLNRQNASRPSRSIVSIFILMVFFGCTAKVSESTASKQSKTDEQASNSQIQTSTDPQYLIFQIFTYAPNAQAQTQPFNKASIKKILDDIIAALGGIHGDGKSRQLGFAVGPLSLDHTDDELRNIIHDSFGIAEEKNVAVVFHVDDSMFWKRRADLWKHSQNVEWIDWNRTIAPSRLISWSLRHGSAPGICYTSPSIRKEISRIAIEVIGSEIKKGIDNLKAKNKEHLFAGIIAGWETRLDDDRQPRIRVGYCALSHLGFSASNPPKDFDAELEKVVWDWAAFWTKELNKARIPKERIYTHFPITDENVHAPIWAAFNEYSRPGFSLYPEKKDFNKLYAELQKHGNPRWALAEGTNVSLSHFAGGSTRGSGLSWENYLGGMFNHGASLVNIFAWQDTRSDFGKSTRSQEAIHAYKKFLKGDRLSEANMKDAAPSRNTLQEKVERINNNLPAWIQKSGRQAEVTRLMPMLEQYVNQQKPQEAENVADEILKLMESR